jgi:GNAT superfamily N-acetyltransferase
MDEGRVSVRRLTAEEAAAAVAALAGVMRDCVDGGASIGFMHPLGEETAERFWRMVADGVARGERALLVAEDERGDMLGTVQLLLATPENQPHRADVAKMMVHRRARRRGVARQLLDAVEGTARAERRTLLVLDTVSGSDAERVYLRAGWQRVGEIPRYALMPDGAPCPTTIFYKAIAPCATLHPVHDAR